ncbi:MAG TPA: T9SS type A sorting domain-containing protein [Caldithrix sp.]|nr:T9SS type A sorting domain-containing protein [Caldithrix sp.]
MIRFYYLSVIVLFFYSQILYTQTATVAEINELRLREFYDTEYITSTLVKLTDKDNGLCRYFDISAKHSRVSDFSTDVQIIDLWSIDTTQFTSKFIRQATIPVGGPVGYPLVIGELNNNGRLDIAGEYKLTNSPQLATSAIVELQADSAFVLQKIYADTDSVIVPLAASDVDMDSLIELNFRYGQFFRNYESSHPDSFPNVFNFKHRMWEISSVVGSETFTDLDNDEFTDVLYLGDDSLPPGSRKVYVAEYNPSINKFEKRFSHHPTPTWRVSGFSVGDFDDDGYKEFATASAFGDVYVFENAGNDTYVQVFQDTITASNAYLTTETNDIDSNGKKEFFVGGSSYLNGYGGNRFYWFEADANDHYQKVRSIFLPGTNILGVSELYNYDVNNDGKDELVFSFEIGLVILAWNPGGYFEVLYLDWWENLNQKIDSITAYDLFNTGKLDIFISVLDIGNQPRIKSFYYRNNLISGLESKNNRQAVHFTLYQNYPNPFNPSTTLAFQLFITQVITLSIYDINGKEVMRLIENQRFAPGLHQVVWNGLNHNGKEVSSGIYLYELKTRGFRQVKKMLYAK